MQANTQQTRSSQPPALCGLWKLPPLILHPFANERGPDRLLEGSRACLALNGLIASGNIHPDELTRLMLAGRHQELRMLFYIGKDLHRWAEQCLDFVARESVLANAGIREQSFFALLIDHTPSAMKEKLAKWGVDDQRAIFARSIGLHAAFNGPPEMGALSTEFLQSYQRFADYLFICHQTMTHYTALPPECFLFDLFASEEYAGMLAAEWKG